MAAGDDVVLNIVLNGIDDILAQLQQLGETGSAAFDALASAAASISGNVGEAGDEIAKTAETSDAAGTSIGHLGQTGERAFTGLASSSEKFVGSLNALSTAGAIGAFEELGRTVEGVAGSFGKAGEAAALILGGITALGAGVAGVVYGFKELATSSAEDVVALENIATQAGTTIENIVGLRSAFAAAGVGSEGFAASFKNLAIRIAEDWPEIVKSVRDSADTLEADQIKIREASVALAGSQDETAKSFLAVREAALGAQDAEAKVQASVISTKEASLALAAANDKVRYSHLDIQSAQLGVQHAEYNLSLAQGADRDKDYESYLRQKDAELALVEAKKRLHEAVQQAERDQLGQQKATLDYNNSLRAQQSAELQSAEAKIKLGTAEREATLVQEKARTTALEASAAQKKYDDDRQKDLPAIAEAIEHITSGTGKLKGDVDLGRVASGDLLKAIELNAGKAKASVDGLGETFKKPEGFDTFLQISETYQKLGKDLDADAKSAITRLALGRQATQELTTAMSQGKDATLDYIKTHQDVGKAIADSAERSKALVASQRVLGDTLQNTKDLIGGTFNEDFSKGFDSLNQALVGNRENLVEFTKNLTNVHQFITDLFRVLSGQPAEGSFMKTLIADAEAFYDTLVKIAGIVDKVAGFLGVKGAKQEDLAKNAEEKKAAEARGETPPPPPLGAGTGFQLTDIIAGRAGELLLYKLGITQANAKPREDQASAPAEFLPPRPSEAAAPAPPASGTPLSDVYSRRVQIGENPVGAPLQVPTPLSGGLGSDLASSISGLASAISGLLQGLKDILITPARAEEHPPQGPGEPRTNPSPTAQSGNVEVSALRDAIAVPLDKLLGLLTPAPAGESGVAGAEKTATDKLTASADKHDIAARKLIDAGTKLDSVADKLGAPRPKPQAQPATKIQTSTTTTTTTTSGGGATPGLSIGATPEQQKAINDQALKELFPGGTGNVPVAVRAPAPTAGVQPDGGYIPPTGTNPAPGVFGSDASQLVGPFAPKGSPLNSTFINQILDKATGFPQASQYPLNANYPYGGPTGAHDFLQNATDEQLRKSGYAGSVDFNSNRYQDQKSFNRDVPRPWIDAPVSIDDDHPDEFAGEERAKYYSKLARTKEGRHYLPEGLYQAEVLPGQGEQYNYPPEPAGAGSPSGGGTGSLGQLLQTAAQTFQNAVQGFATAVGAGTGKPVAGGGTGAGGGAQEVFSPTGWEPPGSENAPPNPQQIGGPAGAQAGSGGIDAGAEHLSEAASAAGEKISSSAESFSSVVQAAAEAFSSAAQDAAAALSAASSKGTSGAPAGQASGGLIHGPGTSTSDSIPIRASAGEYVVRADAVKHWGVATMHAINEMRVPAMRFGGFVERLAAPAYASGGEVPPHQLPFQKIFGGIPTLEPSSTPSPHLVEPAHSAQKRYGAGGLIEWLSAPTSTPAFKSGGLVEWEGLPRFDVGGVVARVMSGVAAPRPSVSANLGSIGGTRESYAVDLRTDHGDITGLRGGPDVVGQLHRASVTARVSRISRRSPNWSGT